jgi:phthalate 4,5-cis-dihydrodiol dehydrogenase
VNCGNRRLRIGVAGLGRAFTVMLPAFADPRVALVGAADPRAEARARFAADFSANTYDTVEELCADPAVEVIYVATPHQHHAQHAALAAQHGKHLLVEKPMALTMEDCAAMNEAAQAAGVHLIVGHSHSFDAPILRTRELIASGAYGAVRMLHASRPTEGAYSALLTFENGAFGSLIYSGYGHFDSDEFSGWIGEMGQAKPANARKLPPHFASAEEEAAFKNARNYGGAAYQPPANQDLAHQHFGTIIVSCERADLRPLPNGVAIYADGTARLDPLPLPSVPRAEVIDELYNAVVHSKPPLHDGAWAMATLEVCLAILQSAREGRDVALAHQIAC